MILNRQLLVLNYLNLNRKVHSHFADNENTSIVLILPIVPIIPECHYNITYYILYLLCTQL